MKKLTSIFLFLICTISLSANAIMNSEKESAVTGKAVDIIVKSKNDEAPAQVVDLSSMFEPVNSEAIDVVVREAMLSAGKDEVPRMMDEDEIRKITEHAASLIDTKDIQKKLEEASARKNVFGRKNKAEETPEVETDGHEGDHPEHYQPQCKEEYSDIPPFLISKVDKGKAGTENYIVSASGASKTRVQGSSDVLAMENFHFANKKNARRIARGTIVTLRGSKEDIAANMAKIKSGGRGFRVPVTVNSANETYQQFADEDDEAAFVKKGDEGMLWSKSMSAPKQDDRFIVMEDTFLMPDVKQKNLKGKGLEPIIDEATGQYKTNKCCQMEDVVKYVLDGNGNPARDGNSNPVKVVKHDEKGNLLPPEQVEKCEVSYMYKVVGALGDQSLNGQIVSINHQCFESAIRPVKKNELDEYEEMLNFMKDNYHSKLTLDQLEFNDWGKARLPLAWEQDTLDPVSGVGANGKFIYYKNGDAFKSDNWGSPTAICSLYNLSDKFFESCMKTKGRTHAQCMPRVGDLSFVTPVKKSRLYNRKRKRWEWKNKDPLAHASHHSGNCIDLRPFRSDDLFNPLEYTDTSVYDQKITQEFVDMAKKLGAKPILFNDSKIKGATRAGGHDNHLHICFPPENKTVKESCASRRPAAKPEGQARSGEISDSK